MHAYAVKLRRMSNVWAEYVRHVVQLGAEYPGDWPDQNEIARRVGVNQATVSRWLSGKKVPTDPAQAASFARAFRRNPLEAFVAADMLSVDEASEALSGESREFLLHLRERIAQEGEEAQRAGTPDMLTPPGVVKRPLKVHANPGGLVDRGLNIPYIDVTTFPNPPRDTAQYIQLTGQIRRVASPDAYLVLATAYLEMLGAQVPDAVMGARNALAHGQAISPHALAEAEALIDATLYSLLDESVAAAESTGTIAAEQEADETP